MIVSRLKCILIKTCIVMQLYVAINSLYNVLEYHGILQHMEAGCTCVRVTVAVEQLIFNYRGFIEWQRASLLASTPPHWLMTN